MKKSLQFIALFCVLSVSLPNEAMFGFGKKQNMADFESTIYKWAQAIAETFHLVKDKYIESVEPERLSKAIVKALNAFVGELDPHSGVLDPKTYGQMLETTQGEFFGIGIVIDGSKEPEHDALKIIDIVPSGPSDKADIRAGDKIVSVDGKTLKGLSVEEVIGKLKGKRNSKVHVKIQRNGVNELLDKTITRDTVKEQNAICYHFTSNNIFYLGLNMFTENSVKQVAELLKKCQSQNSKGLIIDLRNNSGGLLNAVVDIAGLFLDKGSLVVSAKARNNKTIDTFTTTRDPLQLNDVPIFIIVNNYTASAAEILAGALQVYSEGNKQKTNKLKVFLIGSKTWGKGSVQEVIPICNDCAIKLTIALYYLPNGQTVQSKGIEPDFTIPIRVEPNKDIQWLFSNNESNLHNSIKHEHKPDKKIPDVKEDPEKGWQEKRQQQISKDHIVLNTARLIEMAAMLDPKKYSTRKTILDYLRHNFIPNDSIDMTEIKI
jgi:carboxyl-terminal processing protease